MALRQKFNIRAERLEPNMMNRNSSTNKSKARRIQQGFTLLEVMIAMVIMLIGLLSVLAVLGVTVAATQTTQDDMTAKQVASAAMESVFTARDTSQLQFSQIQNISNGGVFNDGFQPVKDAGPDGLMDTADDVSPGPPCPGPSKCVQSAGRDGIIGTADDVYTPLNNFQQQVLIAPLNDTTGSQYQNLRSITVNIRYTSHGMQRNYVMNAYISQFR
jgi:prepilin-type N-terminal cleavage/methylation domain-containing protein